MDEIFWECVSISPEDMDILGKCLGIQEPVEEPPIELEECE